MKKYRFYQLSMLVMAAGMFAACSSDEPQTEVVGPEGTTAYAKVSITFPGSDRFGTRSFGTDNTFEDGTTDESKINSLLFVFYDEDGRAVGHTKLTGSTIPTPTHTANANVQDRYEITVPVSLVPGSKMPTHIMCYANPQTESDQYTNLSEVYGLIRTDYKSAQGFTMNNSLYYDANGNRVIATAIPANGLKKDGDNTELAATEIYIERLASKVSVTTETGFTVDNYAVNAEKFLRFVPEFWSVTATEKNTKLVKNLPATLAGNSTDITGWINSTDNHRTFWARSTSYQETFSAAGFPMTGWDVNNDTKLNYLSYSQVMAKKGDDADTWGGNQYFLETTGRSERLTNTSINGKLALPNALIVGHYEVVNAAGTAIEDYKNGFYLYASQVFTPAEIQAAMLSNHDTYLRKAENTPLTDDEVAALFSVNAVKQYYKNNTLAAAPKHYVAPQTTAAKVTALAGLQYKDGEEWKTVGTSDADLAAFNLFIVKQTNCALSYVKGGKAFYTVLIEHYGNVADGTSTKTIEGSYGLVRNHTYKISISKIAGLASGINNEDDPLIPAPDEVAKFKIAANLNVLAWHVVTQSGVVL